MSDNIEEPNVTWSSLSAFVEQYIDLKIAERLSVTTPDTTITGNVMINGNVVINGNLSANNI